MIPAIAAPTVAIFNESGCDNERRIKLYGRRNEVERRNRMYANMMQQDTYSYYEQRKIAAFNRRGEQGQLCHQKDATSKGRNFIYVALPFDSERQFSCTSDQVFCERCAMDEVGMVNMRHKRGKARR